MFCEKCGTEIIKQGRFCPKCGQPITSVRNEEENIPIASEPITERLSYEQLMNITPCKSDKENMPLKDSSEAVLSVWGYLSTFLLSMIPLVGIIVIIVWAIGSSNKNKTNFCRAIILWWVIGFLLVVIFWSSIAGILYSLM